MITVTHFSVHQADSLIEVFSETVLPPCDKVTLEFKILHPFARQKCLMFNSSFSNFLTKSHLPHPILNIQQNRK